MSRRVNKYKHHLKFLSVCDHKTCKQLIGKADKELINCICECALNILKGSVPLKPQDKKKLIKRKRDLRALTSKSINIADKKRIIQKGNGFLPMLLGPIIATLGSLLFKK